MGNPSTVKGEQRCKRAAVPVLPAAAVPCTAAVGSGLVERLSPLSGAGAPPPPQQHRPALQQRAECKSKLPLLQPQVHAQRIAETYLSFESRSSMIVLSNNWNETGHSTPRTHLSKLCSASAVEALFLGFSSFCQMHMLQALTISFSLHRSCLHRKDPVWSTGSSQVQRTGV